MKLHQNVEKKQSRGFSLAEILVAMFVIVVGISGITASVWWATKNSDSGKVVTEASNHARSIFETVLSHGWVGKPGVADVTDTARSPLRAAPFDQPGLGYIFGEHAVGQELNNDEITSDIDRFSRNIQVINRPAGGYGDNLATLRVRVFWKDGNHERFVNLEGVVIRNV